MVKNTSVVLGAAQESFVRDQIAKGRYATVSEAVRHGCLFCKSGKHGLKRCAGR